MSAETLNRSAEDSACNRYTISAMNVVAEAQTTATATVIRALSPSGRCLP